MIRERKKKKVQLPKYIDFHRAYSPRAISLLGIKNRGSRGEGGARAACIRNFIAQLDDEISDSLSCALQRKEEKKKKKKKLVDFLRGYRERGGENVGLAENFSVMVIKARASHCALIFRSKGPFFAIKTALRLRTFFFFFRVIPDGKERIMCREENFLQWASYSACVRRSFVIGGGAGICPGAFLRSLFSPSLQVVSLFFSPQKKTNHFREYLEIVLE